MCSARGDEGEILTAWLRGSCCGGGVTSFAPSFAEPTALTLTHSEACSEGHQWPSFPFPRECANPLCHILCHEMVIMIQSVKKPGTMAHTCNPSAGDMEADEWILGAPWLASLDYLESS